MTNYFVHSSSIIDEGAQIGSNTKIWHFCHIYSSAVIGEDCIIGQNVMIGPNVVIGNNCKIQNNVSLYEGVIIEDDVFLGPSCVFTNVIKPRSYINQKNNFKKTIIKKRATIGANATIICGITIEENSFVGAGAVVTKNTKKNGLYYGNPAKYKGHINEIF